METGAHCSINPIDDQLARLAGDVFDSLAVQFPICMASDEFHFFPQAMARSFDWSRWADFSPTGLANVIEKLTRWEQELGHIVRQPTLSADDVDAAMLGRVIETALIAGGYIVQAKVALGL